MQEHPLPQDITGYRFHIIGNMTLKQFIEIAAGVVLGVIIYSTNLPAFIKWPIIGIFVGIGAMAAFVPIEERPLDHWIVAFFKAMYKPTKFYWKKTPQIPDVFSYQPKEENATTKQEVDYNPARKERVREFMFSMRGGIQLDEFTQYENTRIDQILTTFSQTKAQPSLQTSITPLKKVTKPQLTIKTRKLKAIPEIKNTITPTSTTTPTTKAVEENVVQIPRSNPIKTTQQIVPRQESTPEAEEINPTTPSQGTYVTHQAQHQVFDAQETNFNTQLPFPSISSVPNKPVGMALGPNNELLANVIVEIKDENGSVARAVKTNSLGQFYITTPLQDGEYLLEAEKNEYQFPRQKLRLNGQVVQPLEIRGSKIG